MKLLNKRNILYILMLACFFIFTGCASIERELDFKPSGLVGIKESVAIQEDLIKLSYNSVDEFYSQADSQFSTGYYLNFKISKYKTEINNSDAYGYTVEGTTTQDIAEKLLSGDGTTFDIEQKGLFVKKIKISITSNQNNQNISQSTNDPWDNLSKQITNGVKNMISDKFVVRVPGKVLVTNGFEDPDNPKTITWDIADIEMGDTQTRDLTVSYLNTPFIISFILLIVVGIIILIVIVLFLVFGLKIIKKHNKTENSLDKYLSKFSADGGKVVYDVFIPGVNNTVGKIDAVLIHDSGLYLFDKMKYEGWISGNDYDDNWLATNKNEEQVSYINPINQTMAQASWMKNKIPNIVDVYSIIVFPEKSNLVSVNNNNPKVKVIRGTKYDGIIESFKVTRGVLFNSDIELIYEELMKTTKLK